ncbi:MAG TPA: hypothetical protein VFE42_22005, partial [Chloroflexota bacterium]|nr:hypothetical protein [Chloroflexota bacterium]
MNDEKDVRSKGGRRSRRRSLALTLLIACALTPAAPVPRIYTVQAAAGHAAANPLAAAYPSYMVGAYYFSGWSHGPNDNL